MMVEFNLARQVLGVKHNVRLSLFKMLNSLVIIVQILYKLQMEVRKSRSIVGLPLFEMKGLMEVREDVQTKERVLFRARQSEFDER